MSAKGGRVIHIGKNGPSPCTADKGRCPYGGESGFENHYSTIEEAHEAYEKMMESEYGDNTPTMSKRQIREEKLSKIDSMSKTEQNKLAKETDDKDVLHKLAESDSARIQSSVLKNPHVDADVLTTMYDNSANGALRQDVIKHPKMELNRLNDDDYLQAIRFNEGFSKAVTSPEFNDRGYSLSLVRASGGENSGYMNMNERDAYVSAYLSENELSDDAKEDILKRYPSAQKHAISHERVSADEIRGFDPSSVEDSGVDRTVLNSREPERIDAIYSLREKLDDNTSLWARKIDSSVISNRNTSSETLSKVMKRESFKKDDDLQEKMLSHPALSEEQRKEISKMSDRAESEYRVLKKTGKRGADLVTELRDMDPAKNQAGVYNSRGRFRDEDVYIDRDKVKEYDLDDTDVSHVFSRLGNAGYRYYPEEGRISLTIDSSD